MGDRVTLETYNNICKLLDIAESTIEEKEKEIERLITVNEARGKTVKLLKREKEWLLKNCISYYVNGWGVSKEYAKKRIIEDMQQALKGK